jgi:3-phenylpropionate/trans-cinnamate dioxygenase ferredoxin subunit
MDGAIDASTSEQARVGRIDDHVGVRIRRDIAEMESDVRHAGQSNGARRSCENIPWVNASEQSAVRLAAVDDLGASQVTVVEGTPHGALAVGISEGKPFAVSNRCRHLFASLGTGHVTEDGCLQCPGHAALYDVDTGKMVRGPQGAFKPLAGAVQATVGSRALKTFPVELRDGAIWLVA